MTDRQIIDFFSSLSFPWASSHLILLFFVFWFLGFAVFIYLLEQGS